VLQGEEGLALMGKSDQAMFNKAGLVAVYSDFPATQNLATLEPVVGGDTTSLFEAGG
jgi:hypothetical protein